MNPLFRIDFSISDSLKIVRKSVLIYETIIPIPLPIPSICLEMQGIRVEIHEQAGADVIRNTLFALRQLC